MSKSLVVVESPAKAKTICKYLGKDYTVLATYGHVRDLLPKDGAINIAEGFKMLYQPIQKSAKAVEAIAKALKKADILYLATDPDREGEAIAWHLCELLEERGILSGKAVHRVVFYEITKDSVRDAIKNPQSLSIDLINAQQARRALDYLVGFNLSPLLWKKIQRGLSAGRVQSPALRMIVEREKEIENFIVREYWTIEADHKHDKIPFSSKLLSLHGKQVKQFTITESKDANAIKRELLEAVGDGLRVEKIEKKQRKSHPHPAFTTSTLQQEGVRKLGFTTQHTMRVAQQLYEGINIGDAEGEIGLITYMRTDSVTLSQQALREIRQVITEYYGKNNVPATARKFKTKAKNAQEAHEAIRPTSANRSPQNIKSALSKDQYKLYELIWKRAIASQMKHATINTVSVDMSCGDGNIFRATGSAVADPGFMLIYQEQQIKDTLLPNLTKADIVKLLEMRAEQHFTEPPPRFNEASLVKILEDYGIGRPSTYANIISTLKRRDYVELDKKRFLPTHTGRVVNDFLSNHFTDYVDYDFTARLEDQLDEVSRGEKAWVPLLEDFWRSFEKKISEKEVTVSRSEAIKARELGIDPKTGLPISVRIGRYGPYAQIGTKDDDEKPKFAALLRGQKLDTITLEEALELFKLPRKLGKTAAGEELIAAIGRFGPYIKHGKKFISLKKPDDPNTIDLERALILIEEAKEADASKQINVFAEQGISVLNGRYGPYITDGKTNARVPKDKQPEKLSLEDCQLLLEKALKHSQQPGKKKRSKARANA